MPDTRADAHIEKSKVGYYDALVGDPSSIFRGKTRTAVFVSAAAVGYYYGKREKLNGQKHTLFVASLSADENLIWILKSIAVSIEGISVLNDFKKVISIAEEYANAGIDKLYETHRDSDDELFETVNMLSDIIKEDNLAAKGEERL